MSAILQQVLQKMTTEHEALIQYSNEKTEAIKNNDIEAISNIIVKEQRHLLLLNKLEEARRSAVYQLLSGKPWEGGEPTVSDCYPFLDKEERMQLEGCVQRLLAVVSELKHLNELNQQLISQSLQFVNMSLSIFQTPEPKISYGKQQGEKKPPIKTSLFDSQA